MSIDVLTVNLHDATYPDSDAKPSLELITAYECHELSCMPECATPAVCALNALARKGNDLTYRDLGGSMRHPISRPLANEIGHQGGLNHAA